MPLLLKNLSFSVTVAASDESSIGKAFFNLKLNTVDPNGVQRSHFARLPVVDYIHLLRQVEDFACSGLKFHK